MILSRLRKKWWSWEARKKKTFEITRIMETSSNDRLVFYNCSILRLTRYFLSSRISKDVLLSNIRRESILIKNYIPKNYIY